MRVQVRYAEDCEGKRAKVAVKRLVATGILETLRALPLLILFSPDCDLEVRTQSCCRPCACLEIRWNYPIEAAG